MKQTDLFIQPSIQAIIRLAPRRPIPSGKSTAPAPTGCRLPHHNANILALDAVVAAQEVFDVDVKVTNDFVVIIVVDIHVNQMFSFVNLIRSLTVM
jgi:hypothetical protein